MAAIDGIPYEITKEKRMRPLIEEREQDIIRWATERNIFAHSNPQAQMLKTVEEVGETARALLKGDKAAFRDGVGDIIVTLVLAARMQDMTLGECVEAAWNEIKDRKGKMWNNVFEKDA